MGSEILIFHLLYQNCVTTK